MSTGKFDKRFTDFNSLNAYLVAQGANYSRALPLYAIGSDGNDSNIIGHWGYDSDGRIVPMGIIRFDRITDGGHAVIANVTNGTTAVVKTDPVSTLASSGQALAFDLSAGTNLYSGINFSIDGTNLTLPDTTGLAVGDVIYAQGRSEFTWGSGSNFSPLKNGVCFVSGSGTYKGLYVSGSCISEIDRFRKQSLTVVLPSTMDKVAVLPLTQVNDRHMVGYFKEYEQYVIGGYNKTNDSKCYVDISGTLQNAQATTWYENQTTELSLKFLCEQLGPSGMYGFQAQGNGTNYFQGSSGNSDKRTYTNNMRLMFSSSYPIVWKEIKF